MKSEELRGKFLDFFKKNEHQEVPAASLVPENDPTTLFTGSGMQPLIPYLLGQPHPLGRRLANSQRSFRSQDIEEVGDNRHTTFFEMLGNWSLGDYFKDEQLPWLFEFLTKEIKLPAERLYVTVFSGDEENSIPADEQSIAIWKRLFAEQGIAAADVVLKNSKQAGELGMQGGRIFAYDSKKNWWSRSGAPESMPAGELGGPDSEVFYEFPQIEHNPAFGKYCHPNCDCGRFLEIGNSVFMEYRKKSDGGFEKLAQRNVDFGGGLERLVAASNNNPDIFEIDIFQKIFAEIKQRYAWDYAAADEEQKRTMRVVADHVRSSVFMIGDGVTPSNKEQGYILRRLLRRAILKAYKFAPGFSNLYPLVAAVTKEYAGFYSDLFAKTEEIRSVIEEEETRFMRTLKKGLQELEKLVQEKEGSLDAHALSGKEAFDLYQTYGYPVELINEELARYGMSVRQEEFNEEFEKEFQKHKELSRTAAAGRFKGGLADASYETTKLHTANHLLLAALRSVLGDHVHQRGSNITAERLRLDFSHQQKLTEEELRKVEDLVNEKIQEGLEMVKVEMPKTEAVKIGAEMEFGVKYGDVVSVYMAKDAQGNAFSKEFCGGPHVANTSELGHFTIPKQEAVGSGIRRIRGQLA